MKVFIKPASVLLSCVGIFWFVLIVTLSNQLDMLGLMLIAFTLGIRHGFDADHIIAIDNVTRNLVSKGARPYSIGIFFALGHSSVVFLLTIFVIIGTISLSHNSTLLGWGGIIGTFTSIIFLWLTAILNFNAFYKNIQHKNKGSNHQVEPKGFFSNKFSQYFSLINQPWKMLIVGFLFGLGFDTATEIALLGITATQVLHGESAYSILFLPVAFASGMCLIDALDGWLIIGLSDWVNHNKNGKFYYNLIITAILGIFSFLIGGFEVLNYCFHSHFVEVFSNHSEVFGFSIVCLVFIIWGLLKFRHRDQKVPPK